MSRRGGIIYLFYINIYQIDQENEKKDDFEEIQNIKSKTKLQPKREAFLKRKEIQKKNLSFLIRPKKVTSYNPKDINCSFRSPFFKSNIEESSGMKIMEAYNRVKNSTKIDENSDQEQNEQDKAIFNEEYITITKGFSQKLLKLLKMNVCIYKIIQHQEYLSKLAI